MMAHGYEQLSTLLKQWRDIEPSSNFEANVRRRIRVVAVAKPELPSSWEMLARWLRGELWRLAWSVATALAIGVAAGLWGGIASAPRPVTTADADFGFLSSRTLSGSYLTLASGDAR